MQSSFTLRNERNRMYI